MGVTRTAYEEMIRRYERLVYTICWRMVGDAAQAEDLAQETFLAAWIHREDCAPGAERAWLCRIAANKAKDYLKSAYRRRVSAQDFLDARQAEREDPHPSPEVQVELGEAIRTLGMQIDRMRAPYREVSALYYFGDCSVNQIARLTGRPSKTVSTQICRARAQLRRELQGLIA